MLISTNQNALKFVKFPTASAKMHATPLTMIAKHDNGLLTKNAQNMKIFNRF
jgi:hypothetical protein